MVNDVRGQRCWPTASYLRSIIWPSGVMQSSDRRAGRCSTIGSWPVQRGDVHRHANPVRNTRRGSGSDLPGSRRPPPSTGKVTSLCTLLGLWRLVTRGFAAPSPPGRHLTGAGAVYGAWENPTPRSSVTNRHTLTSEQTPGRLPSCARFCRRRSQFGGRPLPLRCCRCRPPGLG